MKTKNKKLIIVSSHLPISFMESANGYLPKESNRSLTNAIFGFLKNKEAIERLDIEEVWWVGAANCSSKVWHENKHQIGMQPFKMKPVFLPKQLKQEYYEGFSNTTLWNLFHYMPYLAEYNQSWYDTYQAANELFHKKVNIIAQPGDIVWVHDYHLMLLPEMLRQDYKNLSIGFFLHTPFPSFEIIRLLPQKWRDKILRGVLGADIVGFQTGDFVNHFERTVQELLVKEQNDIAVKRTKVDKFPMGIDFAKFNTAYNTPSVKAFRDDLKEKLPKNKLIISIDRLDYSKGILNRLKGYEHFLEKFPEWQRHVTFLLAIEPSPQDLNKGADLKKEIDACVKRINEKFGTIDWLPIIYKYDSWSFEKTIGLYTAADVALITPMREGMNLIAKEFIAARFDKQGALVLSDMAGAAQELKDAVLTHPTDMEDVANKIRFALLMPEKEQTARMNRMQNLIEKNNVQTWAEDFLTQLEKENNQKTILKPLLVEEKNLMLLDFKNAQKRLILLDYDGTLVNFRPNPDAAKPSAELLFLLKRLSRNRNNHIAIMSGRNAAKLEEWFGHLPITLVAENGIAIRLRNEKDWDIVKNLTTDWKITVKTIIEDYIKRCPETQVVEKAFSLAWHYGRVNKDTGRLRANQLVQELTNLAYLHKLNIINNKHIVEIRPQHIDKGTTTTKLLADAEYDFILAMGDDINDENMFNVLSNKNAYTVKIGQGITSAAYRLTGPLWAIALLENMAGYNEKEADNTFFSAATAF